MTEIQLENLIKDKFNTSELVTSGCYDKLIQQDQTLIFRSFQAGFLIALNMQMDGKLQKITFSLN